MPPPAPAVYRECKDYPHRNLHDVATSCPVDSAIVPHRQPDHVASMLVPSRGFDVGISLHASPAASPPRRTCGRSAAPGPRRARVCRPGRASARPCRGGPGVAGSSRFERAWGLPSTMDSGPGRRGYAPVSWSCRRCSGVHRPDSATCRTDRSGGDSFPAEVRVAFQPERCRVWAKQDAAVLPVSPRAAGDASRTGQP